MALFPTRARLFNIGANELLSRSQGRRPENRITAEEVFTAGSNINLELAAGAAMADETIRHLSASAAALLIDGASKQDLDRIIADKISTSITRKDPSSAVVTLSFNRVDATLPRTVAALSLFRSDQGTEFQLQQAATFVAGSTGPATALARATTTGVSGNVAANRITEFVGARPQADMTVTNPDFTSGGDEEESDPRLRERAKAFFPSAKAGTLAAIELGARGTPGVRSANAVELVDSTGELSGFINLSVADPNGQANQALRDAVDIRLLEFRCGGVNVNIISGVPLEVAIEYSLRFRPGVDTTAASQQLRSITVSGVNQHVPGESFLVSLLAKFAQQVDGIIVDEQTVVAPAGDIVLDTGSSTVFRTSSGIVTTTPRSIG